MIIGWPVSGLDLSQRRWILAVCAPLPSMSELGHSRRSSRTLSTSGLPPDSRHVNEPPVSSVWGQKATSRRLVNRRNLFSILSDLVSPFRETVVRLSPSNGFRYKLEAGLSSPFSRLPVRRSVAQATHELQSCCGLAFRFNAAS
jgi:hypothetical protein